MEITGGERGFGGGLTIAVQRGTPAGTKRKSQSKKKPVKTEEGRPPGEDLPGRGNVLAAGGGPGKKRS